MALKRNIFPLHEQLEPPFLCRAFPSHNQILVFGLVNCAGLTLMIPLRPHLTT